VIDPLTELTVTIPGNPGDAAVNGWKQPTKPRPGATSVRMVKSKRYRTWTTAAARVCRAEAHGRSFSPGPLEATIVAHWPRQHRQGPASGLPFGDVDAVAKATLDALEAAGVLGDDAQVVELRLVKRYDAEWPRIVIEVRRAGDM